MKAFPALGLIAASLLATPALAQTEAARDEDDTAAISAAVQFAMPHLIAGVRTRCAPSLSGDGFLAREGDALIARYSRDADAAWPQARALLVEEMRADSGESESGSVADAFDDMPDEVLKSFVVAFIPSLLAGEIKTEDCSDLEQITAAFAPMPPQNLASLVAGIVRLSERAERREKAAREAAGEAPE